MAKVRDGFFYPKRANSERKKALTRAKKLRFGPCQTCGLYGCICQSNLNEFADLPDPKIKTPLPPKYKPKLTTALYKRPTQAPPNIPSNAPNCPYRCLNADVNCIDCVDKSQFKRK